MNKENKFFPILNINEKTDREQVREGKVKRILIRRLKELETT